MAVVTSTDRPKSVRNRCLIELFVALFVFFTLPFWHFRGCRGFCHKIESDFLLFVFVIKIISSNIHTSVYDKRKDFRFPIVNFPSLSDTVPRLPSYEIYISQLVRFAVVIIAFLIYILKNIFKSLQKFWHRVNISRASENVWEVL